MTDCEHEFYPVMIERGECSVHLWIVCCKYYGYKLVISEWIRE